MRISMLVCLLSIATAWMALASSGTEPAPCKLKNITVPGLSVKSLSATQFAALHAAVAPSGAGERWAEIPWIADLTTARRKAAQERKPLLMWVMDGNPLG